MIKKIIITIISVILIMTLCLPSFAETLTVNGTRIDCYIENGITYASVREFVDLYEKYTVSWDNSAKTASIEGQDLNARVYQGQPYTVANGRVLVRDGINRNKSGRIYAPVTVLCEAVSATASWDPQSRHVTVNGGGIGLENADTFYNSEDLYWLARIISAESRGESFMGKCAVGNVVQSRVISPQFPDSIKGVIFDNNFGVQFSPTADGSIYNEPTPESIMAAKAVLDGFIKVNGALYFLNPRTATNSWIINNRRFCMRIGNHDFYY